MGNTQSGGGGLFSQNNMQQKNVFGNTSNALFTPKTLPSNNNIFGNNQPQGSTFGGTQTNSLNQGGIFGKSTANTTTTNIMNFNNTSGSTSKLGQTRLTQVFGTGQKPMMGISNGTGMGMNMGGNMGGIMGGNMGMNSASGVQNASTNQGERN